MFRFRDHEYWWDMQKVRRGSGPLLLWAVEPFQDGYTEVPMDQIRRAAEWDIGRGTAPEPEHTENTVDLIELDQPDETRVGPVGA